MMTSMNQGASSPMGARAASDLSMTIAPDLVTETLAQFNPDARVTVHYVGTEKTPVIVIDDLLAYPEAMVELACQPIEFVENRQDFYPGKRKTAPHAYSEQLKRQYADLIRSHYQIEPTTQPNCLLSAFSLTMTQPQYLRPIQMLPHFDSPLSEQFAVVHYLFRGPQGGTSLYRHRKTGFETVTHSRIAQYGKTLKQQAYGMHLHQSPAYTNGSGPLFEQIHTVEAKFNRAVLYPSNCLHSADISSTAKLPDDPRTGRLTLNTFLLFQHENT